MSLEVLYAVEQAELHAAQIRANAQQEARDMLTDAENRCAIQMTDAMHVHRTMQKQMGDEASVTVARQLETEKTRLVAERAARREEARQRLPEAVEYICERILDDGSC